MARPPANPQRGVSRKTQSTTEHSTEPNPERAETPTPKATYRQAKAEKLRKDARYLEEGARLLAAHGYHANSNSLTRIVSELNGKAHDWARIA